MKLYYFFIYLILSVNLGYSQATFKRSYGTPNNDFSSSVKQTDDGGYVLFGHTENNGNGRDFYLIRTDSYGNELWEKMYGGPSFDVGFEIEILSDGNFILCGKCQGITDSTLLIKIDEYGSKIWEKKFASSGASAVEQLPDNNLAVIGYAPGIDSGRMLLMKVDLTGELLWSKTYSIGWGRDIKVVNDGLILLGGTIDSTDDGKDLILVKTNFDGEEIWSKTYNTSSNAVWESIDATNEEGFILAGSDNFPAPAGSALVMKTDGEGNELWLKSFGGIAADKAFSIQTTFDGKYVFTGDQGYYPDSAYGLLVCKLDADGNVEWNNLFSECYYGRAIEETNDHGYAILGQGGTAGGADISLIKTDEDGFVSVPAVHLSPKLIQLSPNPVRDFAVLRIMKQQFFPFSLEIKTPLGQVVYHEDAIFTSDFQLSFSEMQSGIYFLYVKNQKSSTEEVIKIVRQ